MDMHVLQTTWNYNNKNLALAIFCFHDLMKNGWIADLQYIDCMHPNLLWRKILNYVIFKNTFKYTKIIWSRLFFITLTLLQEP